MTRKQKVILPPTKEPEPCRHEKAYPVGMSDSSGSRVWYCADPPLGCGKVIGLMPAGWKSNTLGQENAR
jgi:hypothetical protein